MAMSLTSKTHPYKAGFEPFPSDVYRIPYAYCYRCSYCCSIPLAKLRAPIILEDTFKRIVAAESVAAIIVEPVLGEGGFVTPPREFFPTLHAICKQHGILLIADEVQTGFATHRRHVCLRTLRRRARILSLPNLSAGACPSRHHRSRRNHGCPRPAAVGGTFGGNPLACEAALATIETMLCLDLPARANALGERFRARASQWQAQWPQIGEVRGLGGMQAIEFVRGSGSREPNDAAVKHIIQYCYERGVLILNAGSYSNVIRILMPLVISNEQFEEALNVLESAMSHEFASQTVASQVSH